jgi:hypothetical protein
MSKEGMFKNAFDQLSQLWAEVNTLKLRVNGWGEKIAALEQPAPEATSTCPICHGKGMVEFRDDDDAHGPIMCKVCNGIGRVVEKDSLRRIAEAKPAPFSDDEQDERFWQQLNEYMRSHKVKFVSCQLADSLAPQAEPTGETSELYVFDGDDSGIMNVHSATPVQVRAAAVAMGLLDTERQKVAEAFLHAALLDPMNMQEHTYQYLIDWLNEQLKGRLSHMASILESAAKSEAAVLDATKGEQG